MYNYIYMYIYDIPYESDVFHLQKGTRYSQLSWDEMTSLLPKPLEVILETGWKTGHGTSSRSKMGVSLNGGTPKTPQNHNF